LLRYLTVDSQPDATAVLQAGQRIGRYELLRLVGRGGMGEVWQARLGGALGIDTFFAIKVLLAHLSPSAKHRTMLVDEARVVAGLQSPHAARLVELVDDARGLCLVMDWIDGVSIANVMDDGPLPFGVALRIAADACAGLHAAHELLDAHGHPTDLVHRDVSPDNILVDRSGTTKLIDFGIAKTRGRLSADTTSGVKGKLSYMSREQANAEHVDRRTDVFSLAVVVTRMVTGRHPFDVASDIAALASLAKRRPPNPFPPGVPPSVAAILRRAMSHERERRHPTALALRVDLESAMVECGLSTDHSEVARFFAPHFPPRPTKPAGLASTLPMNTPAVPLPAAVPAPNTIPPPVAPAPSVPPRGVQSGASQSNVANSASYIIPLVPRQPVEATKKRASVVGVALRLVGFALVPITIMVLVLGLRERYAPKAPNRPEGLVEAPMSAAAGALAPSAPPVTVAASVVSQPLGSAPRLAPAGRRTVQVGAHAAPSASGHAQGLPTTPAERGCDPPYDIDALGHKIYRADCLR
jgi:eukaryotic-like serine/threonine-protein kinase